jgi:LysM repeat protein
MLKLKPKRPFLAILRKLFWSGLLTVLLFMGPRAGSGSGLLYKNYIIRYDRGWDILCEPYVVQEGDWVLKIFRQKGEIAHNDFRDFTGIFERLNPHIRNIDMLRPGQTVDIPLKKLEHGTLPGQASGIVTIPFVTLAKVTEVVRQHSATYVVQRGDTVSRLIARQYGRYGTKAYHEGVKLFQAANPNISDLNVIYAGQRVYLPEPSIREQEWFAGLHDPAGDMRETVPQNGAPEIPSGRPAPVPARPTPDAALDAHTALSQAAAAVGGALATKGTYYLPQPGADDFEIDLSRYPMLSVAPAGKILFTTQEEVMGKTKEAFAATWPEIKIAGIDPQAATQEIVAAIFEALGQEKDAEADGAELVIEDNGARITVRARWIKPDGDGRSLCITPIGGADEQTPDSIRRYLEQRDIVLKEILPDGRSMTADSRQSEQRHAVKNILSLAPAGQKDFVRNLARALGFTYAPDVPVSFPYAGVQVQAYAHLLSAGQGREVLIDFGDLYGEALEAIRQSGPLVVQITPQDSYSAIARRLLALLQLDFVDTPSFLAARRPADFNTAVAIPGLLYHKTSGERILLSAVDLHPALTDVLSAEDIALVTW